MRTISSLKSIAAFVGGALVLSFSFVAITAKKYSPRNENLNSKNFSGAAEYYHWLKQDPATGKLNLNAMAEFQNEMLVSGKAASAKLNNSALLNLAWEDMGPDNIGGRCRAILVDKNNSNRLFAGAVSGGLFKSTNGGSNWTPINDTLSNLIVSCITQDGDGNIYFGTGEGMARGGGGDGNSAFIGVGLFKMDYNSSNDTYSNPHVLSATVPTPNNNTVASWCYINRVKTSKNKINGNYYIYCATGDGLKLSTNGGTTFVDALTQLNNKFCFDVDVCNDGAVYCAGGNYTGGNNKVYFSPASSLGAQGTYTDVTPAASSVMPWSSFGRIELAASLTNSNIVYASIAKPINTGAATLCGVVQSVNGGTSWNTLGVGNANFEVFATYGQGDYDHVLEVYPNNDYSILLGGVDGWRWDAVSPANNPSVGSWSQNTYQFGFPFYPKYVHADHHAITFDPSNPNIVYFGTDGGVSKSVDGGQTFSTMNFGFNATQFYAMAYERDALYTFGPNIGKYNGAGVLGGTQDNGTPYINGNGNTVRNGESINGGDGFYCEASMLSPNTFFYTSYYGFLERTSSRDDNGADFYPADRANLITCSNTAQPGDFSFASFVTPIALWETSSLSNGADSVQFVVDSLKLSNITVANGAQQTFNFNIALPQNSTVIDASTIKITAGNQVVTSNASGILSGSGTGTFTAPNQISVTFNSVPAQGTIIKLVSAVSYSAGSLLSVTSASLNMKFNHTLSNAIATGDTIHIMDPIQSRLAIGLSGAVYVCKNPLNFTAIPNWVKVAGTNSRSDAGAANAFSGTVQTLEWGGINNLYVATTAGVLWRVSGLGQVINSEQDIDSLVVSSATWTCSRNTQSPITIEKIAGFSGRAITSVAVDPTNPDRIAITLGNYGVNSHVYYCNNATTCASSTTASNFTALPNISSPVYASSFIQTSHNQQNPNYLLIGTEVGVRSIDLNSPTSWSNEGLNGSGIFPNVPTFMIRQQTLGNWECYNSGVIYAATHGRGIFKSNAYYQPLAVSVPEIEAADKTVVKSIKVFPNPANDQTTVNFNLASAQNVMIAVYDLKGSKVSSISCGRLQNGTQNITVPLDGLSKGTYILGVIGDNDVLGTTRLVKIND
ncbi:MAG: T9SS type A sorting domain-containing protein [Bacteroidota bacterium]|jgi:hypothetical protein